MSKTTRQKIFGSALLVAGLTLALAAGAQNGDMKHDHAAGDGMQQMSGMMHDSAGQMMNMSGDMSKGTMGAAQQKQMGERMRTMSEMMDKMSGMMGNGMGMGMSMDKGMDPAMQKQMGEMHKQMEMMHNQADKKH